MHRVANKLDAIPTPLGVGHREVQGLVQREYEQNTSKEAPVNDITTLT